MFFCHKAIAIRSAVYCCGLTFLVRIICQAPKTEIPFCLWGKEPSFMLIFWVFDWESEDVFLPPTLTFTSCELYSLASYPIQVQDLATVLKTRLVFVASSWFLAPKHHYSADFTPSLQPRILPFYLLWNSATTS